ncbi:hypothetical protein [Gloeothece verrucosa]|nr:hypothetical protein [Gloeothece verrucosa]
MNKRVIVSLLACFLVVTVCLGGCKAVANNPKGHIYFSQGVHNTEGCGQSNDNCIATRNLDDPSDPEYPQWWISDWTMYRVFQHYKEVPPPYDLPPKDLTPDDYEVSYGTTYYDSTYIPEDGDGEGAMLEHYEKRCLPIFPQNNHYTCSFVSLGNKAYFLRYDDQNPNQKPNICFFSPYNHPPRTDFIKHLPYNTEESTHLNNSLQAYSIRVPNGDQDILFGYAFNKNSTGDSFNKSAKPYRHPQSFYFSGDPNPEPNAPIVSQNYTNFRMEQPEPLMWKEIVEILPPKLESCCLFANDCPNSVSKSKDQLSSGLDALTYSKN